MHHRSRRPLAATLTIVLSTAAIGPAAAQENGRPTTPPEPITAGGSVTLPYAELRALLLAAQAPKPPPVPPPPAPPVPPVPPVAFNVGAARFALEVAADGRSVRGRAAFEVQTFVEGWTVIPLLPATEARLTGVEPAGTLVAVRGDSLALLVDKPGRQTVTLLFSAPLADGGKLALHPASALVNEVTVANVPAGSVPEITGATRDETTGAFHLAAGQPLALTLAREEDRRPAPAPAPSAWRVAAEALVRYDDGRLVYRARLRAGDDAGPGLKLELLLPEDADVSAVRGPDLLRWQSTRTAAGRRLEILWQTADTPRREVFVDYERPQATPASDWVLVAPRVAVPEGDPAPTPSLFALLLPEEVEFIAAPGGPSLAPAEPRALPRWLAAEVGGARFVLLPSEPLGNAPRVAAARRPILPAPVPSVWRIEAEPFVRYDDGRLVYQTRLRAATDAGSGLSLELALPAAANVLQVTGTDLDRWRSSVAPDGRRRLVATWKTADTLRRELFVDYELPQPTPDGEWPLASPQAVASEGAPNPEPTPATYTLALPDGIELPGAAPGDARGLPRWLAEALNGAPFVTLPSAPSARARRLPLVPTAPATVEDAAFKTRLVADGATLTEARFNVRHDGPLPFAVALPEGTTLLACAVDGRETAPVDRGDHRLEFPLPAGTTKGAVSRVTFSYTGRSSAPLSPTAGQLALSLPQTGLFTQTLQWDLQIPDAYELTALDGNVELTAGRNPADTAIHLRKELLKGERPAAELFYQKRALTP